MDSLSTDWPSLEMKNDGDNDTNDSAVEQALSAFTATANQRIEAAEEKAATALKRAEDAELAAKRRGVSIATDEDNTAEKKAFNAYLRGGTEALAGEEVKALTVSPDTGGGYLAPSDFQIELIKEIVQFSPVRQVARVGSTGTGEVVLPKRTGRPTGKWIGETEKRSETGSTYGQLQIPVHEIGCYVDVSQRLLEDSQIDVDAEVRFDLAEEFATLESTAFVNGDGLKKPTGFMTDDTVVEVPSGDAAKLTADGIVTLFYSIKSAYRANGVFMANPNTIAAIRKLKNTMGDYLWVEALSAGQPASLLGKPLIEAVDLPDIGAGKNPVVFGNFDRAYRIYDRIGTTILRDPFTVADEGLIRFHARKRVGGSLVLPEAIAKMKIATS